jgi:hypothetical protein
MVGVCFFRFAVDGALDDQILCLRVYDRLDCEYAGCILGWMLLIGRGGQTLRSQLMSP